MEYIFLKSFKKDLQRFNKETARIIEERLIPEIVKNPSTLHKLEHKGDTIYSHHFDIPDKKTKTHYRIMFKVFENKVYFLMAGERKVFSEEENQFLKEIDKRILELKKIG